MHDSRKGEGGGDGGGKRSGTWKREYYAMEMLHSYEGKGSEFDVLVQTVDFTIHLDIQFVIFISVHRR